MQRNDFDMNGYAYGFDMKSLNLIYDYVPNRKQTVKLCGTYISR